MPFYLLFRVAAFILYPLTTLFYLRAIFVLLYEQVMVLKPRDAWSGSFFFDHPGVHAEILLSLALIAVFHVAFAWRRDRSAIEELLFEGVVGLLLVGIAAFVAFYALATLTSIFVLPLTATGFFLAAQLGVIALIIMFGTQ